jgi:hypothetical protein
MPAGLGGMRVAHGIFDPILYVNAYKIEGFLCGLALMWALRYLGAGMNRNFLMVIFICDQI